ncbi:MAG: hypothetical protein HYU74_13235 [Dechloromonas sp.]|nr:hypothetical protein [Dechloromonas sp.]
MHCIPLSKWHDFKFTNDQRRSISASFPKKFQNQFSKKIENFDRYSGAELFEKNCNVFLEQIEDALGHYFDSRRLNDDLDLRPSVIRNEVIQMATQARLLKKSIERLPVSKKMAFEAHFFALHLGPKNDDKVMHLEVDYDLNLLVEMLGKFEGICNSLTGKPLKTGVDKKLEHALIAEIVTSFEQFIGKASASPNGVLFRIIKTVCDVFKITIGEDLFRRAVQEYAMPEGYWSEKT